MQFRQFAGELIEQKKSLETQFPLAPGAIANTSGNAPEAVQMATTMAAEVQRARGALLNVLGGQANRIQELGGNLAYSLYREAQYVMAVTADELMLNGAWLGRSQWRLLEEELFQSHAAGDIFFERIERLLAPPVLVSTELAMIYLQALALDFRGRYRGHDPQHQLEQYRRYLYGRIFGHTPEKEVHDRLFSLSYAQESDGEVRRIASAHVWWLVLAGVCVLWVVGSALLWEQISAPIDAKVHTIQQHSRVKPAAETEGVAP
jgi:type VI secretion system protein ImpK